MIQYRIDFSKYKLRDYERHIALRELHGQFQEIDSIAVGDEFVELTVKDFLDEAKLRNLTFFSEYHFQNSSIFKSNVSTNQTIVESCKNFQPDLFSGFTPGKTREIRYLTHDLHEYKGRFYPQLAKSLMNYAGLEKGDTVLDPFCGSGTTLVEALLFGANAIGLDINPLSYLLAKTKVNSLKLSEKELDAILKQFEPLHEDKGWQQIQPEIYRDIDIEYLQNWFPEDNLKKILFIRQIAANLPNENWQLLPNSVLSNLLRDYSYQDPSQLRIRRRADVPPSNLVETFSSNLFRHIRELKNFRSFGQHNFENSVENHLGDTRTLMKDTGLTSQSVDAVITSPPYATALPYVDTDRLSLFAFGFTDRKNFRKLEESVIGNREITRKRREQIEQQLVYNFSNPQLPDSVIGLLKKIFHLNKDTDVGFRRKNTAALLFQYFMDMDTSIRQLYEVLKPDRYAFFVVGNNRTTAGSGETIEIPTDDFIAQIAERNGFAPVEKINMTVQKGYMIHAKNAINAESVTVLRKK